jgi:phage-related minor tail protein
MDPDRDARTLSASLSQMKSLAGGFGDELSAATEAMRAMDRQAAKLSRSLGSSLRSAFDKAVFGGDKLGGVLRDLASDVAGRTLDAALKPVSTAVTEGIGGLTARLAAGVTGAVGFARGGVIDAGEVRAFARGGVVDRPTVFPMRDGTGLMGEAGPEAILPLSRGPDGRLGVQARSGGGQVINVTIATPDVESFRRSRGQVAAELARAVRRGDSRL